MKKYPVITLCGSTRFKEEFERVQKELTLKGYIVISVGLFGHSGDDEVWEGMSENTLTETKRMLDDMHKKKIDMAGSIFVINPGGYIGDSTWSEISYACMLGKKIEFLEDVPQHAIQATVRERIEKAEQIAMQNLDYIRPPLKDHFAAFLGDTGFISNIKDSIRNLKVKVDDDIFREWCDALIQCQDDNTLKDTLQPIITKLTDVRIVNSELTAMMSSVRIEYYTMVGMVVGNIPLLYVLNKDWFHTLMYETAGKITLGVCGLVIFVTYLFMLKFTKPVAYKG